MELKNSSPFLKRHYNLFFYKNQSTAFKSFVFPAFWDYAVAANKET